MKLSSRLQEAAERIVEGDDSMQAAQVLETAILDEYYGDENLEPLLYAVSMYSPTGGKNYYNYRDLVAEIVRTLRESSDW